MPRDECLLARFATVGPYVPKTVDMRQLLPATSVVRDRRQSHQKKHTDRQTYEQFGSRTDPVRT